MRPFSTVLLILLLAWNSVLGGYEALLCLHPEGDAHMELVGPGEPHADESGCFAPKSTASIEAVATCTDWLIGSADTGPYRNNELKSVKVLAPVVGGDLHWLAESMILPSRPPAVSLPLVQDLPGDASAPLITRTIVLRL